MRDPKDIIINGKQLSDILDAHKNWLEGKIGENLSIADLSNANLRYADLRNADLRNANLSYADLSDANLSNANLSNANLSYANLRYANLSYADLSDANLSNANLSNANLSNANLSYANLSNADLSDAKNKEMADAITKILPDGDIIGWKKCNEGIVKLLIPAKAKRSNATGRKCRAEYAKDVAHFTFDGRRTREVFTSQYDSGFLYEVGKIIKPNNAWDENRWDECSSGIHFFITEWEARNY
jgi:hypothetical protein